MTRGTVVVTGAAGDLGRACASAAEGDGWTVVRVDRRPGPGSLAADLADPDEVGRLLEDVVADGGVLRGLVNCAGTYEALDGDTTTADDFARMWRDNVMTVWSTSMAFSRRCIEGARIVNFTSISGAHGSPDVAYGTSKAAVAGLTKSLAKHFGPRIRVNAVSPGVVEGSMADRIPADRRESYRAGSTLGRLGRPPDVAAMVVALLGPAAEWMTGSIIEIDGGMS